MTTKERIEKNNQRVEDMQNKAINNYQKTCLFKFIGYMLCVALISIIVLIALVIVTFIVWNHFNPTQDYLYFVVIYLIIDGIFFNMIVIAIAGSMIKKHAKKVCFEMKMHERKINRYFHYYKKELNGENDTIDDNKE